MKRMKKYSYILLALPLLLGRAPSQTAPLQSLTTAKSKPIAVLRVSLSVGSMKAALLLSLTVRGTFWAAGRRALRPIGPLLRSPVLAFLIHSASFFLRLLLRGVSLLSCQTIRSSLVIAMSSMARVLSWPTSGLSLLCGSVWAGLERPSNAIARPLRRFYCYLFQRDSC